MKKLKYVGDISPCRIKIFNSLFNNLKKGDIIELDDKHTKKLLNDNNNFILEGEVKEEKKQEEKSESVEDEECDYDPELDLTGDGKVCKDDYALAARTLLHARKKKNR